MQAGTVGALHVEARQQRGALGCAVGIVGGLAADIDEAQRTVALSLRESLHMGDLAPAQRATAVVQHGQHVGWLGRLHGNSSGHGHASRFCTGFGA